MAANLINSIKALGQKENIAIDIGASSVKICQVRKEKDKWRVLAYANLPLEEASIIEDEIGRPEHVIEVIQVAISEAKANGVKVNIGLSSPNSLTKKMNVIGATTEELEDNVLWECEQYIPFGVDDSEIDFEILSDGPNDSKNVFMAAARYDVVETYSNLINEAKLKLSVVDLNVLALYNAFVEAHGRENQGKAEPVVVIDFGAQTTKVVVIKDLEPILTKEIDVGGLLITEEIQRQVGVSYLEAEDLKIHGDSAGNLPEQVADIIEDKIKSFLEELKKVLNFYVSAGSSEPLDACYITGGSASLPGLQQALTQELAVPVQLMDLQERVAFARHITDEQANDFLQYGTTVFGLGMRK